jgi:hypothetical protein
MTASSPALPTTLEPPALLLLPPSLAVPLPAEFCPAEPAMGSNPTSYRPEHPDSTTQATAAAEPNNFIV